MVTDVDAAKTIGDIVAAIVRGAMASDPSGAMLRVRGFDRAEVVAAISALKDLRPAAGGRIQLVAIAHGSIDGIPANCMLPPNSSATTLRNELGTQDALVYFEVEAHSDQQSLAKVTTIDDRSVLSDASRFALVQEHAWRGVGALLDLPRSLKQVLEDAHEALVEARQVANGGHVGEIPLREWVPYVVAVAKAVAAHSRAVEESEVLACVSGALPLLGLFEDPELRLSRTRFDRKRRIKRNAWYADGRDRLGNETEPDDVVQSAERTRFERPDGVQCSDVECAAIRDVVRARAYSKQSDARVAFHYWDQLFAPKSKRRGLGDRVRDFLADRFPDRAGDLTADDVNGLNASDQQAARTLMEPLAPQEEGGEQQPAIYDLLDPVLARSVDKIAYPSARVVADPYRDLVREIYSMIRELEESGEEHDDAAKTIVIGYDDQSGVDARRTAALFAFFYGRSLSPVAAGQRLVYGLEIRDELLHPGDLFAPGQADDDDGNEIEWSPVRLTLRWKSELKPDRTLEWKPSNDFSSTSFARLLRCSESPWWSTVDARFEQWAEAASCTVTDAPPGAGDASSVATGGATAQWLAKRRDVFAALASTGLEAAALLGYVDEWSKILGNAFSQLVPKGEPLEELDAFLRVDTFQSTTHGGELVLLGTHPTKLRWLAQHLQRMTKLLGSVLDGTCDLSPVNDAFYFEQLALLSAHDQPPVLAHGHSLYLAVREIGLHEVFAKVKESGRDVRDWLSDVDDESIDELANVVDTYVDAYPHAADGLSLCLVLQNGGGPLLTRLLRKIRSRVSKRVPELALNVTVVAPRTSFAELDDAVAEFDQTEERRFGDYPRLSVALRHWDNTTLPGAEVLSALDLQFDLAVVPNLFGAYTRSQDRTRQLSSVVGGGFQPWLDKPTVLRPSEDGRAHASRELLPDRRDEILEWWSTLCVRQFRGHPVGDVGPDAVDFLALQVSLESGSDFFQSLHDRARWVVTLDEFIGRDQVEALRSRPDIITVRPRVGSAETYALIVSSHGGEDYIVDRVARRLRAYVPALNKQADESARELFERARVLSPGLLLRASGLGRTSQELVGLAVTRWAAARHFPIDQVNRAFEAWISLDEHLDWFGGRRAYRADLLRLAGHWVDQRLHVRAWIVEAKLRDGWVTEHADRQVASTIELFAHALRPTKGDGVTDGEFWRRAVLEAMEQSSKQLRTKHGEHRSEFPALIAWEQDRDGSRLPDAVREAWFEGNYELAGIAGIVCTVAPIDSLPPDSPRTPSGYHWIKLARTDLQSALREMADPTPPSPAAAPTTGTPSPTTPSQAPPSSVPAIGSAPVSAPSAAVENKTVGAQQAPAMRTRRFDIARLERKYQIVLDAFTDHRVQVHRPPEDPYYEGPGFYVFRVVPGSGMATEKIKRMTEELKLKLGLPAEDQPRSYVDRGAVVFEVPKPDGERYFVDAAELWARTPMRPDALYTALGEDVKGEIVGIDFSSADSPHLLVAGTTGSGKSIALETLLFGLARNYSPAQLKLLLVDPKGTELTMLEKDPHLLRPIGMDAQDAIGYLEEAVGEMERRRNVFRESRARTLPEYNKAVDDSERLPWWLVVLDEYADLTSDSDDRKEVEARLQRLSQKARASGIHVVVATQKPTVEVIGSIIRSNLPAQLALRVKTATDSRVIMDEGGAESLAGKGDAFLKTARGTIRLQCAAVGR